MILAQDADDTALLRPPHNGKVYVIAHRGAHKGIPENTLAAYRKAIEVGADFVEIDVRTTKDGHLVSIHNSTVDAYTKDGSQGRVRDLTLEQLRALDIGSRVNSRWAKECIPTFGEILALCRGRTGIYLDLKDASIEDCVRQIHHYQMERQVLWCIDPQRVDAIRAACPACIPMPDPKPGHSLEDMLNATRARIVAPVWSDFSPDFAPVCEKKGVLVFVDERSSTPDNWAIALKWGADGIQTDDPEGLIRYLKGTER